MKSNSELPPISGLVDLKRLEEMSDGGPDGIRELAMMYIGAMDANLLKLQEAVNNQRPEEIERIAHSAVGSSSLIGVVGLVPVLRKIEELGERKAMPQVPLALLELRTIYGHLCDYFKSEGIIPTSDDVK